MWIFVEQGTKEWHKSGKRWFVKLLLVNAMVTDRQQLAKEEVEEIGKS